MRIDQFDLETRSKVYNFTKKILRKYQKGITTGKLTADKFADNILSDGLIEEIINKNVLTNDTFKESYIDYIQTLINIQNENLHNSKKKRDKKLNNKPSIPQKLNLQKLLLSTGYELTIPYEYLNKSDVDKITSFITTGFLPLGNEQIYNYVKKTNDYTIN